MRVIHSIADTLRRIGAGLAAAHQGEYLQGWLPAMEQRPQRPARTHRTEPRPPSATAPASRTEPPYLEQGGRVGAC